MIQHYLPSINVPEVFCLIDFSFYYISEKMSAVKSRIDQLIKNHIVFVISKRTCPFCHTAKNILNKYDILPEQFKVLEIDGDKDCADIQDYMLQLTGGRTVPRVFIQGKEY